MSKSLGILKAVIHLNKTLTLYCFLLLNPSNKTQSVSHHHFQWFKRKKNKKKKLKLLHAV